MPDGEIFATYKQLIIDLATEFNGPSFDPHITVVPDYLGHIEEIKKRLMMGLTRINHPLTVELEGPITGNQFYQCVYLLGQKTPQLMELFGSIREQFEQPLGFMSHLSLFYGEKSVEERKIIAEKARAIMNKRELKTQISFSTMTIYQTGTLTESSERVAGWKMVETIAFAH